MSSPTILVAKSAGFCWGVRRAFNKVLEIAASNKDSNVYTYGPLIHNPQAVEMLAQKGISVLDQIPESIEATVAIRTHGIPPEERNRLRKSGAQICDATCPDVGIIQGTVRKHINKGFFVIIIGHKDHPEVKALLGFAENRGACVNTAQEIEALPQSYEKVCVVSQSTQQRERFDLLVELIKKRYPESVVFDTICKSTDMRQQEVRELAQKVDAMVVVGGRDSSNTNRLAEISRELGTPTYLVETEDEMDLEELKHSKTIGVTAGASTPSWVIENVVAKLRTINVQR